jgi:hypothetical protein
LAAAGTPAWTGDGIRATAKARIEQTLLNKHIGAPLSNMTINKSAVDGIMELL